MASDPSTRDLYRDIEQLLYREAYYLDTHQWQSWLELFTPDVDYWMPAWISEDTLATDRETQLSLIHCEGREGLEDRVFRIETGDSFASHPLPRTCHVISNILLLEPTQEHHTVSASWTVHQYLPTKGARVHGGRYEYTLFDQQGPLAIRAKKIIFINDGVDIPIDIYNV